MYDKKKPLIGEGSLNFKCQMSNVCIIVWVMQVSNNVIDCYVFYVNNYAIVN
jgi:hypothetical protein